MFLASEISWMSESGDESFYGMISSDGNIQELVSQLTAVIDGMFATVIVLSSKICLILCEIKLFLT